MSASLRFSVEVAADQATGALNALSAAFSQAGIDAKTKLLAVGPAAHGAGKEVEGLGGALKSFASEQRQQGRVASFFVNELAALTPVSDSVKNALGGVTGALVGGFGLGMALDLAVTGVRLLSDHFGEAARKEEEARQAAEAHRKALVALTAENESYLRSVSGATSTLEFLYSKRREFEQANEKDIKRRDELDALVFDNERQGITTTNDLLEERERVTKRVEAAQKQWNAAVDAAFVQRANWERDVAAVKAADEARADARRRGEEMIKQGRAALWEEEKKLTRERLLMREDERQKIRMQLQYELEDLRKHLGAGDALVAASRAARRVAREKIRELEFRDAKAKHDQELAALLSQQEQEADAAERRFEMRKGAARTLAALSVVGAPGGDMGRATALAALEAETEAKLNQIRAYETESVVATEDAERLRTAITEDASRKRQEILAGEAAASQRIQAMATDAFRSLATTAVGSLLQVTTRSAAYERAMKAAGNTTRMSADLSAAAFAKMGQDMMSTLAQRASVEALMEIAYGLRDTALGLPTAGIHYASAAMFGAVAAAAGTAAVAIGQSRGMTRGERDSVSAYQQSQASSLGSPSASDGREQGTSGGIAQTHTREVVVIVGEGMFTPQELAAAHARRDVLARELGLMRSGA